jgi:hypothetical protein
VAKDDHGCSMRIGVNAGSLERDLLERYGEPPPEAMVESALNNNAKIFEDHDFFEFKISCKSFRRVSRRAALLKSNRIRLRADVFGLSSIILVQPTKPVNGGFTLRPISRRRANGRLGAILRIR